jgi:hypothetical protein
MHAVVAKDFGIAGIELAGGVRHSASYRNRTSDDQAAGSERIGNAQPIEKIYGARAPPDPYRGFRQ